jgi:hypothetical protein
MNILVPKAHYPRHEVISKTDRVPIASRLPYQKYDSFQCTRHAVARKHTLLNYYTLITSVTLRCNDHKALSNAPLIHAPEASGSNLDPKTENPK